MARQDEFVMNEPDSPKADKVKTHILKTQTIDFSKYEISADHKTLSENELDPNKINTVHDLIRHLEKDPNVLIEARVLHYNTKEKKFETKKLNRKEFIESYKKNSTKFKESFDSFGFNDGSSGSLVGQDFIPLLGGPFNKQLYLTDFLKQNQLCFYAYHHDPIANNIVHTIRDFTLGRGFKVDFEDQKHQALWEAFAEANDLQDMFNYIAIEFSYGGEIMLWWLPDNQTSIVVNRSLNQPDPKGSIPRVRLMDTSMIWEIITWPEDITRPLAYQWVSPTQYQIYSNVDGKDGKPNTSVPSTKYIFQQIPADQVDHFKINCVSNEKRGRSDLFPVLGYLKRLRDTVNYSILALQKVAAWAMDTTIEGSQQDVDNYVSAQQQEGTIASAASEFVHTSKVKREYMGNAAGKSGKNEAFEWTLSMIAAGTKIPVSYLGTHMSAGSTRGSAVVATEPVAKMFEFRQLQYERVLRKMIKRVMNLNGIKEYTAEVTFPEIMAQDRSAKLKDLGIAEMNKWISPERAATMASKEFQITDYEYELEMEKIKQQKPEEMTVPTTTNNPLTSSGLLPNTDQESEISSDEKKDIKQVDR